MLVKYYFTFIFSNNMFELITLFSNFVNFLIYFTVFLIIILLYWFNVWEHSLFNSNYFKVVIFFFIGSLSIFFYYLAVLFYYHLPIMWKSENFFSLQAFFSNDVIFTINLFNSPEFMLQFVINKFNVSFLLLFFLLYWIVFVTIWHDYSATNIKFYLYFFIIFNLIFLLVLVDNIILFYFIYETILIVVFAAMYLTSYSRAAIDALLYFLIWAIIGSILVAYGFFLLINLTNTTNFSELLWMNFSSEEVYYIYLLFFFGFGVKLSIWPFWYWLPKAHVEVSTGMSIFLSCVLIKLSLYCLLKLQFYIYFYSHNNICILVCFFCIFDVIFRFLNLRDLKAVIAYSSVLHTNLLVALIHIDNTTILSNSMLYIWGHSLATAVLFWVTAYLEYKYNTRSLVKLSGLWQNDSKLAKLLFFSLLSFIDIPVTMMFWGELWVWLNIVSTHPFLCFELYFLSGILFVIFFFKIWWSVLLGTGVTIVDKITENNFNVFCFLVGFFIFLNILFGLHPALLKYGLL